MSLRPYELKSFKRCLCGKNEISTKATYCEQCRPNDSYCKKVRPKEMLVKNWQYYQEKDKHRIDLKTHVKTR